ncbi:hypothetical protein [Nannocystis sp. SCPEA4]|uniref:hypothetical protein n=1 Tax=Nannocystis sp. SCPEA4 TaxID=2996787 RepID=UPI0022718EEA|nr:hypothetical protein [Nannocystis sp. SCPEA4]MCY1056674.1 hypothetical protein [Nannocystis sp. SCPEA4]
MVTFVVALVAATSRAFAFTGRLFLDFVLVSALLLGLFAAVVQLAVFLRTCRFGAEPKVPRTSATDLLMAYLAALFGPLLVAGFLPRVLAPEADGRGLDVVLLLVGVWFTTMPVQMFHAYAFRR